MLTNPLVSVFSVFANVGCKTAHVFVSYIFPAIGVILAVALTAITVGGVLMYIYTSMPKIIAAIASLFGIVYGIVMWYDCSTVYEKMSPFPLGLYFVTAMMIFFTSVFALMSTMVDDYETEMRHNFIPKKIIKKLKEKRA